MRRSGWIAPGASLAVWVAAVGFPALAVPGLLSAGSATDVEVRHAGALLATSCIWAAAVAVAAMIAGWAPGRLLGRAVGRRWSMPLAALLLAPVCLPAYVIFYAWWQSWPADSALFRWAVETDRVQLVKAVTLFVGFVSWSWPLAAWCVAGQAADTPRWRQEILELDGAGPLRRLADRLRSDGRGLALGGLIVFLFVFNNTTSFDVAQFFTFGYELKAIDALNAPPRAILAAALPAMAVAAAGAAIVWRLLGRSGAAAMPIRTGRPTRAGAAATATLWVLTAALPVGLFLRNLGPEASVETFVRLYGTDLVNTIVIAVACGIVAAMVTVGLAAAWQDHRPGVRGLATAQAIGWLLAGLVPGTIVGIALEAAYNRPGLDGLVYTNPAILVLGYVARFGFIAALLARWLTLREPTVLADMRRLDGADDLFGYLKATWPRLLAAAGAAFAVVAVLSMSELSVSARLQPRGFNTIAGAVLNAVHYQRPDTVMLAVVALIGLGLTAGFAAVAGWWPLRRFSGRLATLAVCGAAVAAGAGCGTAGADPGGGPEPLDMRAAFGTPGRSLGQFSYPRGIAVDVARQKLYVVDKTARVQRFGFDGVPQLQWRLPKWENGKPTGLGVADDGRVFVADTHYHRVIVYDPEGRELLRFGTYGQGPGQFIFPTDVAFGPGDQVYVSEYGGNERIGVFDDGGEFLFSFGGPGSEPGKYNRPQALAFSPDRQELYIADSCNHRVVVVTPQGEPLRVIGGPGRGPGQLAYPYDVLVLDDRTLLVCEFGNNRIQHFSPEGACLGVYGRVGSGDGEVQYPWGIDGTGRAIFVLDSGNNRVQRVGI